MLETFSSVCKEWYVLLSRQDFVRVHCSRSLISSNQRVFLINELACYVHPIIFQFNDYGPSSIVTILHSITKIMMCLCLFLGNRLLEKYSFHPHLDWPADTFWGGTLYYTVCECWLRGDYWIKVLTCPPIPPISLSFWCDITHYVTNGNWFVMTKLGKLFTIEMDMKLFECFYPVIWFCCFKGVVFVETVIPPTI
ncbi:hypothetical protein Hanom_Chr16g01463851 [Helianthus anomalus]